jgi:hypothetical protein
MHFNPKLFKGLKAMICSLSDDMIQESKAESPLFLIQVLSNLCADERNQLMQPRLLLLPLLSDLIIECLLQALLVVLLFLLIFHEHSFPHLFQSL